MLPCLATILSPGKQLLSLAYWLQQSPQPFRVIYLCIRWPAICVWVKFCVDLSSSSSLRLAVKSLLSVEKFEKLGTIFTTPRGLHFQDQIGFNKIVSRFANIRRWSLDSSMFGQRKGICRNRRDKRSSRLAGFCRLVWRNWLQAGIGRHGWKK